MNDQNFPYTAEERLAKMHHKYVENHGPTPEVSIEKHRQVLTSIDPSYSDLVMGHEYLTGSKNVKRDFAMAAAYYAKAASKNNADALYNLALLHMKGLGVKTDFEAAINLLTKAASQPPTMNKTNLPNVGVSEAEHSLALAYELGTYVDTNMQQAIYWYKRAVEHNQPNSANNLGLIYMNGNGATQDLDTAEKLFLLAHKLGNADAPANLIQLYLIKEDADRALMWHERCVNDDAMMYMSTQNGDGIEKAIKAIQLKKSLAKQCFKDEQKISEISRVSENFNALAIREITNTLVMH